MDWSIAWIDRLAENEDLVRRTRRAQEPPTRKKMIMTPKAGDKLMSLTDVSEMLGIPVHTLYRWRYRGDGPVGYRVGRHVRYRREAVEAWLEQQADQRS
jgi:excisionase family DNA binding protein